MMTIKELMDNCNGDISAMKVVAEATAMYGTADELHEASAILRREATKRIQMRTLHVEKLMLNRNLKGHLNKLAQEAGVPVEEVEVVQLVMREVK